MFEEVKGLESWYLAGADLSQGSYTRRTALHVVSTRDTWGRSRGKVHVVSEYL